MDILTIIKKDRIANMVFIDEYEGIDTFNIHCDLSNICKDCDVKQNI